MPEIVATIGCLTTNCPELIEVRHASGVKIVGAYCARCGEPRCRNCGETRNQHLSAVDQLFCRTNVWNP